MVSLWDKLAKAWSSCAWHPRSLSPRRRRSIAVQIEDLDVRIAPAVYTIPVTADGVIADVNGDGVFDSVDTSGSGITTHFSLGPVESEERGVYEFDMSPIPTDSVLTSVVLRVNFTEVTVPPSLDYWHIRFLAAQGDGTVNQNDLSNDTTPVREFQLPLTYTIPTDSTSQYDISLSPLYFQSRLGRAQYLSLLSQMLSVDGRLTVSSRDDPQGAPAPQLIVTTADEPSEVDTVLTVTQDTTTISEADGPNAMTLTISRTGGDLFQPLVINLLSSDPTAATVPSQVTIPAQATSVQVPVTAIDDSILDGSQLVRFAAYADQGVSSFSKQSTDPNFGGDNGIMVPGVQRQDEPVDAGHSNELYHKIVVQPDGKIITLISRSLVDPQLGGPASTLTRMNPDGTCDTTFGINGVVNLSIPNPIFTTTAGLTIQRDGKIVVVGTDDGLDWTLARYNPDGGIDKTFGNFGVVHDINPLRSKAPEEAARDVVQLSNDNLLVSGIRSDVVPGDTHFAVAVYSPSGVLLSGVGGTTNSNYFPAIQSSDRMDVMHGLAVAPDGRVIIVGGSGIIVGPPPMEIQYEYGNHAPAVWSISATGIPDPHVKEYEFPTFFGVGEAIAVQPNGQFLIAVRLRAPLLAPDGELAGNPGDIAVIRLNANLSLDGSFASIGYDIIHVNLGSPDSQKLSIAAAPSGAIVVGASTVIGGKQVPIFIGYDSHGNRDESFGPEGIYALDAPNGFSALHGASIQSMTMQADGKLLALVVGYDGASVIRFVSGLTGFNSDPIVVTDHETVTLTVNRNAVSESGGPFAASGTVTRGNTDLDLPVTVVLTSSDLSELTVPATVTIPAHGTFASFPISAVDDALFDGNQLVTLTASASGYVSGVANMIVTDNELPGSIQAGDILVTRPGQIPATYEIAEYTPAGSFVHSITVTWGGSGPRPASEILRDLIQDQIGQLYLYDGTNTPDLATVSPPSTTFTSQTFSGWSTSGVGGAGGIATFHQFVFVSDSNTSSGVPAGLLRFDRTDNSVLRVDNPLGYQDLAMGLNGLLYALNQSQHIDIYDPVTLALMSSVDLPAGDYRGIAVKANGQILAAGANGMLYLFSSTGSQLAAVSSGAVSLIDIDVEPGGRVIAGSLAGDVIVTDDNLTNPTKFSASSAPAYVAFAIDASFPAPTIHTSSGAIVIPENDPPTSFDPGILVTDDGTSLVGATLTFSSGYVSDGDRLTIADQNGITGQFDADTGTLQLVGAASVSAYQAALRSVKYFTINNTPATSRTVTVTVNDGSFTASATRVIQVSPQNDPPRVTANQFFIVAENAPDATVVGTVTGADDDSPSLGNYTIVSGNATGAFAINPTTGVITVADTTQLDFEVVHSFVLGITVSDGSLVSAVQTVTILVADLNDNVPIIRPGQAFFISENSPNNSHVGTVAATDVDSVGSIQNFAIVSGNGAGIFSIDPSSGDLVALNGAALDYENQKTYTLGIRVSDGIHQSVIETVQINLTDQNDVAPVVTAATFTLAENSPNATAVGTVTATDVDTVGTLSGYAIVSGNQLNAFQIDAITGLITVKTSSALNFESNPQFTLGIIVSDGLRFSAVQTVTIQLTDVNESPALNPATFSIPELSANGFVIGTLHGVDPDAGQALTYAITSGNAGGALTLNSTTGVLSVLNGALLDFETTPIYSFTVTAVDNGVPTLFGSAVITVNLTNVNDAPTINSGQSFTVAENTANGVNLGTIAAHDADAGSSLAYSITAGNSSGAFVLNPSTGVLSVADSTKLNFEAVSSFTLTVKVTDNGTPALSASTAVVVQVTNVNEVPTITPVTFTIPENSAKPTVVGTVVAQDPDAGQSELYSIIGGNTNNAFSIHFTLGTITVNNPAALDFETTPTFTLLIKVQDNGNPSLSSTGTVTINLTDTTEPPSILNQSFSVSEAAHTGDVVGTVVATQSDPQLPLLYEIVGGNSNGTFALDSVTGVLAIADPAVLDFETQPALSLQVQVTKPGSPALSNVGTITVNLIDANEPPLINGAAFNIDENSAGGTLIGTVSATDPDAGQSLSFSITGGNTNNAFAIDSNTGALRVAPVASLNFENVADYVLTVTVTDNGNPALSQTANIAVHINDVNEAPDLQSVSVSVPEDTLAGTVLTTLTATNPDSNQQLTYSITGGNSSGIFAIDSATDQLRVVPDQAFNFESQTQYVLTVQVVDNGQPALSSQATVTIQITNVNEPPHFASQTFTLPENAPAGTVLGTITATDEDAGQQITYAVTASDVPGLLTINSGGVLSIAQAGLLDFETRPVVHFTIQASDNGTPSAAESHEFTLQLTNIDEAPAIVLSPGVRVLTKPLAKQAVDPTATIRDADSPTVNVANCTLEVRVVGTASASDKMRLLKSKQGNISIKGARIFYQGTEVGQVTSGKKSSTLTVRFNSAATQAAVEGVLQKVSFVMKGSPGDTRILEFTLSGLPNGQSSHAQKTVQLG